MPSKQLNHCGTLSINRRAYVLIQQQLNDEDAKTQMLLDRAVVFFAIFSGLQIFYLENKMTE